MAQYDPKAIEGKWQKKWLEEKVFWAKDDSEKPKYYQLETFPYPSGAGLHVGHPKGYIAEDIHARYMRMHGKEVLYTMGWDAFGLPTENYAIKVGKSPKEVAKENTDMFRKQVWMFGLSYDWDREIDTSSPEYYKWTQWIFIQLFKKGLAYRKAARVNWCPKDQTVLANEQVVNGKCDRCGSEIEERDMEQWFFKITDYAERLLADLKGLDWPAATIKRQEDWIGKSEGAEIDFLLDFKKNPKDNERRGPNEEKAAIKIFTTRADTLFGATYIVLAPEHPWVTLSIDDQHDVLLNKDEVKAYALAASHKTERMRQEEARDKTGVEIKGVKAINPATKEEIPIWVADYVLGSYGTGAIMAVPAHDERDFVFAKKFNLPIRSIVQADKASEAIIVEIDDLDTSGAAMALKALGTPKEHTTPSIRAYAVPVAKADDVVAILKKEGIGNETDHAVIMSGHGFVLVKGGTIEFARAFTGDGVHIDSDFLNGLRNEAAIEKISAWLESEGNGVRKIVYRIRDWSVSRQRYWGTPIPMIHCEACALRDPSGQGIVPVPENELPVLLPDLENYRPQGMPPLAASPEFINVKCPQCGGDAKRDPETLDTFVDSSWYYLRYTDPHNGAAIFDKSKAAHWLPIDLYVIGAEHTVLHLLYSRFITKFLHDGGWLGFKEPFLALRHQGLIRGTDGQKMSKSKGNVVNPDPLIEEFGADTVRLYEMFMGPFEDGSPWDPKGILGMERFLKRIWIYITDLIDMKKKDEYKNAVTNPLKKSILHKTIKKIGEDIESFKFNTAISALMILLNSFSEIKEGEGGTFAMLNAEDLGSLMKMLHPFAPHMAQELWSLMGRETYLDFEAWPTYDPALIAEEKITLVFQVNGKVRATVSVDAKITEDAAKELALTHEKVKAALGVQAPTRVIYVDKKLVNVVI